MLAFVLYDVRTPCRFVHERNKQKAPVDLLVIVRVNQLYALVVPYGIVVRISQVHCSFSRAIALWS